MISLHLLRHAHAGDPATWGGDDDVRPLSDRGRAQSARLGRLLVAAGEAPDLFITSPRLRASQTAEIVAHELKAKVVTDDRLAGQLDADMIDAVLRAAGEARRPCIVGHDPDFSHLLGALVGLDAIPMRKGAIARVDITGDRVAAGRGTLRYLLPPELVPER